MDLHPHRVVRYTYHMIFYFSHRLVGFGSLFKHTKNNLNMKTIVAQSTQANNSDIQK